MTRTVKRVIHWKRQGKALAVSSGDTVYVWWPIWLLGVLGWSRALNVVVHDLGHQVQAIFPDPLAVLEGGHHADECNCIMQRGEDMAFWGTLLWKHSMVTRAQAAAFLRRGRLSLSP